MSCTLLLQHSSFPNPLRISMVYPRELPKKKSFKEESKAFEEEPPDTEGPVSRQKKQLLVDCLTAIIRYPRPPFHLPSFLPSHFSSCISPSFRSPGTFLPGVGGGRVENSFTRSLTVKLLGQTRSNRAG